MISSRHEHECRICHRRFECLQVIHCAKVSDHPEFDKRPVCYRNECRIGGYIASNARLLGEKARRTGSAVTMLTSATPADTARWLVCYKLSGKTYGGSNVVVADCAAEAEQRWRCNHSHIQADYVKAWPAFLEVRR